MNSRDAILQAVQRANAAALRAPDDQASAYRSCGTLSGDARQARFLERLEAYGVHVTCVDGDGGVATAVERRLTAAGVDRAAAPADLPAPWRTAAVAWLEAERLDAYALDAVPAAVTGCALAIAETGSLVLDGGEAQGPRALTLLPDHHVCVVRDVQLVETLPEAIARLAATGVQGRPLTFISGPSATADIEFERVAGVHGPRRLEVVFIRSKQPKAPEALR